MNKELITRRNLFDDLWKIDNLYNAICASTSYKVRVPILLIQSNINSTVHNVYRITKTTLMDETKNRSKK
ncbi:unnamed protein product [marine sediment metagenome]|uniref:Uncharacterized protein n=1 Tax=marine sediment metagenome TaxID=412755 RepID=X0SS62_9ZZZZ